VEVTLDPRFNGPPGSANGGYTCGIVARLLGAPVAEVTLRAPPPLGRALRIVRDGGRVALCDADVLVAEGVPGKLELEVPAPVAPEAARRASARYPGFEEHAFPTCFVCGPQRPQQDGLAIFAGPVGELPGLVAAPWVPPHEVSRELVWAALDCPGAFAVGHGSGRGEMVLGRLAARVTRTPVPGEECVVSGWPLGEDGRKLFAGTAIHSGEGELLATARATWIEPRA
jgi:hypothetical protein